MSKISVIGAGAWGTALAQSLTMEHEVLLWAREAEVVDSINNQQENTMFLPGVELNKNIQPTNDLEQAASNNMILLVTPAQHVRAALKSLKNNLSDEKTIVICAKGIEIETGHLMSQVADEETPDATIAVLSGPTFASEIARRLPSAVTIAAQNKDVAQDIREALASKMLRPYITDDMVGAQIGGAVKNVIAIACGIIMGRDMGESARAALMTRGMAEMGRLATAMGGKKETLMGMCGIGDVMLTCTSMQSRNYSLGVEIGQGRTLEEIMGTRRSVTEGVHTARALIVKAAKNAVDMPIATAVHKCLSENMPIDLAIEQMLERPLRIETK